MCDDFRASYLWHNSRRGNTLKAPAAGLFTVALDAPIWPKAGFLTALEELDATGYED